jgi:hypothetical protein
MARAWQAGTAKHRHDCPKTPHKQHAGSSTVAVQAPIWLLDAQGQQVEELTEAQYEERYHQKPRLH